MSVTSENITFVIKDLCWKARLDLEYLDYLNEKMDPRDNHLLLSLTVCCLLCRTITAVADTGSVKSEFSLKWL